MEPLGRSEHPKPSDNGVARLLAAKGLTAGKLEKLCFVALPDAPAGRETIRRYASGERAEDEWNEEVILAMAIATKTRVVDISPIAYERLAAKRDRYAQTPIFLATSSGSAAEQMTLALSAA